MGDGFLFWKIFNFVTFSAPSELVHVDEVDKEGKIDIYPFG